MSEAKMNGWRSRDREGYLATAALRNGHLKPDGRTHRCIAAWQCAKCRLVAAELIRGTTRAACTTEPRR